MARSFTTPVSTLCAYTSARITSIPSSSAAARTVKQSLQQQSRGHKTTARTKRSLKIAPHASFLPSRTNTPKQDTIIYNPPASEVSPHHTPFIFLPRSDPRRIALIQSRGVNPGAPPADATATTSGDADADAADPSVALPPEMKYKRRDPKGHMTIEDIREMKRLRAEDPLKWSANALAKKFACSPVFVSVAAPAPRQHTQWLAGKMERKQSRWGAKKAEAKEERKMRTEMMYNGEL